VGRGESRECVSIGRDEGDVNIHYRTTGKREKGKTLKDIKKTKQSRGKSA